MERMGRGPAGALLLAAIALGCAREPASGPIDPEHPLGSTLPAVALAAFQNQALPGSLGDDGGARLVGPRIFSTTRATGPTSSGPSPTAARRTSMRPGSCSPLPDTTRRWWSRRGPERRRHPPADPHPDGERPAGHGVAERAGRRWRAPRSRRCGALVQPERPRPGRHRARARRTFWLADEHGPSLVHLARDGRVLERWLPRGRALVGAEYPVAEILPAALARREADRGLESLAATGEGRFLYAMMEGPPVRRVVLKTLSRARSDFSRSTPSSPRRSGSGSTFPKSRLATRPQSRRRSARSRSSARAPSSRWRRCPRPRVSIGSTSKGPRACSAGPSTRSPARPWTAWMPAASPVRGSGPSPSRSCSTSPGGTWAGSKGSPSWTRTRSRWLPTTASASWRLRRSSPSTPTPILSREPAPLQLITIRLGASLPLGR